MKTEFTEAELIALLKERIGGKTLKEAAADIGCSFQMVSDVLQGRRSVGNENILAYLAPKGKTFVHEDRYRLVAKGK